MVERYRDQQHLLDLLRERVRQTEEIVEAPWSAHLEQRRNDVQARLSDPSTPSTALSWLRGVEQSLRSEVERWMQLEGDIRLSGWRQMIENPDRPERVWAIRALLGYGRLDLVTQIVSKEELLALLPHLQLSEDASAYARRHLLTD